MKLQLLFFASFLSLSSIFAQVDKRKLTPNDVYNYKYISNPQVSPDGNWVLYSVAKPDSVKDKRLSDLFMVNWNAEEEVQLTYSEVGESNAKFSPDGKYISYLSSKKVDSLENTQLWVMNRKGGEARHITKVEGELSDYEWSPDASKVVLVMKEKHDKRKKPKTKKPIVIDRYHFKQDRDGFLNDKTNHLYLLDVKSGNIEQLTNGKYEESSPEWSPDGSKIVFVSNRTDDPDRNDNTDLYIIEAKKDAEIKQLTSWAGAEEKPKWSKDGKSIAFLRSTADDTFINYDQNILAIINPDGSGLKLLTESLDRPVTDFEWGKDDKSIGFLVKDDRRSYVAEVKLSNGKIEEIIGGERSFSALKTNSSGDWLTIMSEPQKPSNLYSLAKGEIQQLTHINEDWLKNIELANVNGFQSESEDGTLVSGLFYKPADAGNERLPFILFIHGGPVAQDEFSFDFTRQMLAADGYGVAAVNYRGSNGRGIDFSKAIYADWGNLEVQDLLGATDHLVNEGLIDPEKLGIGGWSYGSILTNYTIAKDKRYKAAISGAGSSMQLSMYGIDQYLLQWNLEVGLPWEEEGLERYLDLSYPFLNADKITTPTLFMVGENDFNVPSQGSEQMYAAFKTLNIPTQLVIYPDQYHGLQVLSYEVDRFKRYLDWYGEYLK